MLDFEVFGEGEHFLKRDGGHLLGARILVGFWVQGVVLEEDVGLGDLAGEVFLEHLVELDGRELELLHEVVEEFVEEELLAEFVELLESVVADLGEEGFGFLDVVVELFGFEFVEGVFGLGAGLAWGCIAIGVAVD